MKTLTPAVFAFLFFISCAQETPTPEHHPAHHVDHERKIAAPCSSSDHDGIAVADAWVRATTDIGGTSAAYFTLCNLSSTPITLNAISTPAASAAEIHETTRSEDGVVSMKPVGGLVVAPGASIAFEPGGMHVMLIAVTESISDGNAVHLEFEFSDGTLVETAATARSLLPDAQHNH